MRSLRILLTGLICLALFGHAHADGSDASRARRTAVVSAALGQVGVRETSFNSGPEVDGYIRFVGSPPRSAWCSCFVSWCYRQGGVWTARFGRARDWFDKAHTIWQAGVQLAGRLLPQPGDAVGYTWGSGRICHVELLKLWGRGVTCATIGGNTQGHGKSREGDGVYECWRDKRQIAAVADVIDNPKY